MCWHKTYLGPLFAARTGLAQPDAEQRVDTVVVQLNDAQLKGRHAADTARKAAAKLLIVVALSMVVGAFIAGAAGALGGSCPDVYFARLKHSTIVSPGNCGQELLVGLF